MDFDIEAILRQKFGGPAGIMGQSARQKRRPGTKPKFIKLHPQDDGRGLDDVFFEGASEYATEITVKLSVYQHRSSHVRSAQKPVRRGAVLGCISVRPGRSP
jgi:hypothetical protein